MRSNPDRAYYLKAAQTICGFYRRDEAHDPQTFAAGLAAVLSDYSQQVVEYAADPRTGVCVEYPMGLPNIGQIREFCDVIARRMEMLARPKAVPAPAPTLPILPGQIDSIEFALRVASKELHARPIGRFEQPSDEWNRHRIGGLP